MTEATRDHQVALRHFAYFPGTAITAAAWSVLPRPWDDYRFFVLLTTLGGLAAALLFPGPLVRRLVLGAVIAASPLAVRAAWFGTADAPSVLCTVLAFALVARRRLFWAAAALAAAVVLKQFALVALPFLALAALQRHERRDVLRAAALFAALVAVGLLPFVVWDPGAFWSDTIEYGGKTYRIVGYGLSGLLVKAGVIDRRTDPYPFLPLLAVVWLPITVWLLWVQRRSQELWFAAAGFAVSIFMLVFWVASSSRRTSCGRSSESRWRLPSPLTARHRSTDEARPPVVARPRSVSRLRVRQEQAQQREHERGRDQPGDEQPPLHYAVSGATSPAAGS